MLVVEHRAAGTLSFRCHLKAGKIEICGNKEKENSVIRPNPQGGGWGAERAGRQPAGRHAGRKNPCLPQAWPPRGVGPSLKRSLVGPQITKSSRNGHFE